MKLRHPYPRSSSGLARLLAALAAPVLTLALFSAVAFGLTDDGSWGVLALEAGRTAATTVPA